MHTGYRWYLVARDVARDDWRTFRVDRISEPPADRRPLTCRTTHPGRRVVRGPRGHPAPYRYQARVVIHAPAAVVAERVTPTTGMLEAAGPDRCLLTSGADSLEAIVLHLADLGHDFTILEPPGLLTVVRDLAARLSRAATPPRPAP